MIEEAINLGEALMLKFEEFGLWAEEFLMTKEEYVGREERKEVSMILKGYGKEEHFQAFKQELSEKEQEVEFVVEFGPKPGDEILGLQVYSLETGDPFMLSTEENNEKLVLLGFWDTADDSYKELLTHFHELTERNDAWNNKLEVFLINLDKNFEAAEKILNEFSGRKIKSSWAGPQKLKSPAAASLGISEIPCCVLLKQGKLIWKGDFSNRNLESDISSLLENKPLPPNTPKHDSVSIQIPEDLHNSLSSQAKSLLSKLKSSYPSLYSLELQSILSTKLCKGSPPTSSYKFHLIGSVLSKYQSVLDNFLSSLNAIYPEVINSVFIQSPYEIRRGSQCSICDNRLDPSETQFLCVFCEPKHYHCIECHIKERNENGSLGLAHPHSLFRIEPESNDLDELVYGPDQIAQDRFYEEEPDELVHMTACCDNGEDEEAECQGIILGKRFKCANCIDFDLCESCMEKWNRNRNDRMVDNANNKGHFIKHVFIEIPFPR